MIFYLLSLGYVSTWISMKIGMSIQLFHAATTPRCSELEGYTTLPQPIQLWVVVPSPAWLSSAIASMTRHWHRAVAKLHRQHRRQHDLTAPSPVWLSIDITPWSSRLSNTVTSMTRHRHRAVAMSPQLHPHQHDSTTSSPIWLDIDIASQPSRLGSVTTSMT
jgi:hypothetical protein